MSGLWDQAGVPHKGWTCIAIEDVEREYESCEMCGNEKIRYVHTMTHPSHADELRVGCICASKMEEGYAAAEAEKTLRNRSTRRSKWLTRDWRVSQKGNEFLNLTANEERKNVVVFGSARRWGFMINDRDDDEAQSIRGSGYASSDEAKLAAFDALFPSRLQRS